MPQQGFPVQVGEVRLLLALWACFLGKKVKNWVCCTCDMYLCCMRRAMHRVHINVFVVEWMVLIFCIGSTPVSGEWSRCSPALRQLIAGLINQRMWILGWTMSTVSTGHSIHLLTGHPRRLLFDSTLSNHDQTFSPRSKFQVKPTM